MTQEQADMRREELARVIVTKQDARIRELEEAVRIAVAFAKAVDEYGPCAIDNRKAFEALKRHWDAIKANPITAAELKREAR